VSKQRYGGLGRGLGALIPTGPAEERGDHSWPPDVMSANGAEPKVEGPDPAPNPPAATSAAITRIPVRVPSVASLAASSATDFYFEPSPVPGALFRELPPDQITTNPRQPRQVFDEDSLAELAFSIREFGVLQPIVVRVRGEGYELVMGERRLRAAVVAGLDRIPAIVRDTADDAMLRDALLENIHRAQLNPLEEAAAYQQLLEEFGATHDELASRIGRSRSQVSNTIRLMNLPVSVQRRVAAGVISAGHARALLGLGSADAQDELAGRIVAEGLSVRATEELVTIVVRSASEDARPSSRFTPGRPAAKPRVPRSSLAAVESQLADRFDTKVKIDLGLRKGRIAVEFGSLDDLERILSLIDPKIALDRESS
jgi:ParB family chromosome partitioning protein